MVLDIWIICCCWLNTIAEFELCIYGRSEGDGFLNLEMTTRIYDNLGYCTNRTSCINQYDAIA